MSRSRQAMLAFRFWMYSIYIKMCEVFQVQSKIYSVGASDADLMEKQMFQQDAFIYQSIKHNSILNHESLSSIWRSLKYDWNALKYDYLLWPGISTARR